jgi:hypothetical protein
MELMVADSFLSLSEASAQLKTLGYWYDPVCGRDHGRLCGCTRKTWETEPFANSGGPCELISGFFSFAWIETKAGAACPRKFPDAQEYVAILQGRQHERIRRFAV